MTSPDVTTLLRFTPDSIGNLELSPGCEIPFGAFRLERLHAGCVVSIAYRYTRLPERFAPRLDPRHQLCHHSPTGFEWGYGGSGPAQLAFAMLYQVCFGMTNVSARDARLGPIWAFHQDFKRCVVAGIGLGACFLLRGEIATWFSFVRRNPVAIGHAPAVRVIPMPEE